MIEVTGLAQLDNAFERVATRSEPMKVFTLVSTHSSGMLTYCVWCRKDCPPIGG